jgi:hypothetical protein
VSVCKCTSARVCGCVCGVVGGCVCVARKVVLGLVCGSAGSNLPAAQYRGSTVFWTTARGDGIGPGRLQITVKV